MRLCFRDFPNHIDLPACARHGLTVLEGRGSPISLAQPPWALILNARRQLIPAIAGMYAGKWQTNMGARLAGQTLGIWGYGRIGLRLARYAEAFDMDVLAWGGDTSRSAAVGSGHTAAASRAEFFERSDVLTLNLRLVESTRHLVTREDLSLMKSSALLVNTSRAELIAPGALLDALHAGRPGFAAVDVFEDNPVLDASHPLLQHPRVLCTPHLGCVEKEGYELYFSDALQNVVSFSK